MEPYLDTERPSSSNRPLREVGSPVFLLNYTIQLEWYYRGSVS